MKAILTLLILAVTSQTTIMAQQSARVKRFKTLQLLYKISGKQVLSGIHNREPNDTPARWTDAIKKTTGQYPALWSGDFLFQTENIAARQKMVDEAIRQWQRGAVVNIMWHACNPALEEPCAWDKQGVLSKLSDAQWKDLITDGSALNKRWKQRMDAVAPYLQQLQKAGVEVLWRPLHEMNQGVFWWGGRPGPEGTRNLYRLTHDYLTQVKKLDNLIWVWDIQDFETLAQDAVNYNPGEAYWDVLALDIYDDKTGFSNTKYEIIKKTAGEKPIALGECQVYPTAEVLAAQPHWTFFMGWSELVYKYNTEAAIRRLFADPRVLTLEKLKAAKFQTNTRVPR
ncbi:glycoside hydrolase [Pedobacter yulinensis]|uniref:Glycoside hydrolase n=1 Tax=Pedobacter yulinensis TaxID=2126353 RepID=A0A2T3HJX4_9SPHI|nr:glycosyl hydrolase [Pedobacter yulinensis]PST82734.1 glycoside hydrolase [Pedobacter yulinensis]